MFFEEDILLCIIAIERNRAKRKKCWVEELRKKKKVKKMRMLREYEAKFVSAWMVEGEKDEYNDLS